MKRLLLLSFVSFVAFAPQLHSISLTEYIEQKGMPELINGQIDYNGEPIVVRNCLDLSNKNLTDIDGLQNIPNSDQIIILNLSNNRLRMLPSNIFSALHNLRIFILNNTQLQALPDTIFRDLINLQVLQLQNNRLKNLPDTIFNNLHNLKSLYLGANKLQELPNTIFNNLHNLEVLSLYNTPLQTLPDGIFNRLRKLKHIFLCGNQFRTLPKNTFNGLSNLTHLELRGNQFNLDFIPQLAEIIHTIPNLEILNGKQKDETLSKVPFSTLKQTAAKFIIDNINDYRHRIKELPQDLVDEIAPAQEFGRNWWCSIV